jgi:hypothetical protein
MAHEHGKSLNPTNVRKRLEDYEQMLHYYTLIRTKNKMKDSKARFEEWWEVAQEYFTKELEKNLAQDIVDERIMRYKLEAYQKDFLNLICGNSTDIKVLGPSGTTQEKEMHIEELHDL